MNKRVYFENVIHETKGMVYHLGMRLFKNAEDALDFSQDVYLQAYSKLHKFKNRSKISTWLYVLAFNLGLKKINKDKRLSISCDTVKVEICEDASDEMLEENMVREELSARLNDLLLKLPQVYRIPIFLHYFESLSYKEIAARLDIKIGTLKTYMHQGRRILYDQLKQNGVIPKDLLESIHPINKNA